MLTVALWVIARFAQWALWNGAGEDLALSLTPCPLCPRKRTTADVSICQLCPRSVFVHRQVGRRCPRI